MRRIAGLLAAALCLPGLLGAAEGGATTCGADSGAVTDPFPAAPGSLVDVVADPDLSGRLWATDGATIRRSDDAGCAWDDRYTLDGSLTGTEARIVDIASPTGDPDWVSALVFEPSPIVPNQVALRVLTTRDAGNTWIDIDEGLPEDAQIDQPETCDRTCGMVGTTDGDDTLYLWFTEPAGVNLYWSISGGRSFTPRSVPADPLGFEVRTTQPAEQMVTDDPGYFGLFGSRAGAGATASDDGGRTWNTWPEHFEDFPDATFAFPDETPGQAADREVDRLLVAELDGAGALVATHAKYTDVLGWHRAPAAGVTGRVTGLTSLGDASVLAVTTTDGIWVGEQLRLAEIVWRPLLEGSDLRDVQFADGLLWVHDGDGIQALDPRVLPRLLDLPPVPTPPAELNLPPFDPANPIGPLPGTFTGVDDVVRLTPGQETLVDLDLAVPSTEPAVDIFFLIARHGSMQDDLDTLTREFFFVVKDLVERGVDVNVGVGVYGSQVRYHRYRDIGPPNDEFKKILDDIYGFGPVSAAYTAIDAAMVGTVYPDTATRFGTYKGLETHWRPNTTRVVVHVTDQEPMTDDELNGEEGATIEQARDALVEVGALHLGLVSGDTNTPLATYAPARMQDLSRVSGAIAVAPIDCNGDGIDDVPAGEPIVCFVPAGGTNEAVSDLGLLAGFGDVVVDLLGAATDISPLTFHTTTPELVTRIGAVGDVTTIDLRTDSLIPAVAAIRCSNDLAGTTTTTRLSAASGTRGLATTTLQIQCGEPPVVPAPVVAAAAAPAPAAVQQPVTQQVQVVPPAAPPPIANVPPSTNVIPNTGFASAEQREEQRQEAHIGRDAPREDAEAEFAFSAVRRTDPAPAATLVIGSAMALGAAGALARRRQFAARRQPITTSRNSRG